MIEYITAHWLEWLFGIIVAALTAFCRDIAKRLKEEQAKSEAIATGVQALLRENIIATYNKYQDKGFAPIFVKESLKKVYAAYHNLGGNDVASELYRKLLAMSEKEKEDDEQ